MTNQQGAPEARCQACIDRHDGFYGSWAPDCPRHNYDGTPRSAALVEAQQPAPSAAPAVSDEDEALDLLATLFDAWENGTPCYEEPESSDGFLGHAFRLDDEVFHRCADLLNRRRGKQPSPTPQADSQPAPVLDSLALMKVVMRADEALAGRYTRGTTNWAAAIGKAVQDAVLAARAPADSVTAPAGGASMRDDFEAYWRSKYAPLPMNTRLRDDGRYGDHTIQQEWESWSATHAPTPPTSSADSRKGE